MLNIFTVNDKVKVTQESFQRAFNANRSVHAYPSDYFISLFQTRIGQEAVVLYRHAPGYDVTIIFPDNCAFHCRCDWVEKA